MAKPPASKPKKATGKQKKAKKAKPKRKAASRFTKNHTKRLVRIMGIIQPIGNDEKTMMKRRFNKGLHKRHRRDVKGLMRKWKSLYAERPKTGDPRCPRLVRAAKTVQRAMYIKSDMDNGDFEDISNDYPEYDRGSMQNVPMPDLDLGSDSEDEGSSEDSSSSVGDSFDDYSSSSDDDDSSSDDDDSSSDDDTDKPTSSDKAEDVDDTKEGKADASAESLASDFGGEVVEEEEEELADGDADSTAEVPTRAALSSSAAASTSGGTKKKAAPASAAPSSSAASTSDGKKKTKKKQRSRRKKGKSRPVSAAEAVPHPMAGGFRRHRNRGKGEDGDGEKMSALDVSEFNARQRHLQWEASQRARALELNAIAARDERRFALQQQQTNIMMMCMMKMAGMPPIPMPPVINPGVTSPAATTPPPGAAARVAFMPPGLGTRPEVPPNSPSLAAAFEAEERSPQKEDKEEGGEDDPASLTV